MKQPITILQVALPVPLRRTFDYLPMDGHEIFTFEPGIRVKVPFGPQKMTGILVGISDKSIVPQSQLKKIEAYYDEQPLLTPTLLELCQFAAHYYQHPIGEVMATAFPSLLRAGKSTRIPTVQWYRLTAAGAVVTMQQCRRARQQWKLLELLRQHPEGCEEAMIKAADITRAILQRVQARGWIEIYTENVVPIRSHLLKHELPLSLNLEQQTATTTILSATDHFHAFLLEGVTGSGKTEVYLRVIEHMLTLDRQSLVLVPEIGLTPQTVARFQSRFPTACIAVFHSGLTDTERLHAWELTRRGIAKIIIGTRSALFTPWHTPGVIIIDEEHDPSFKQQEGFRYSARDLAIYRAYLEDVPIILGSATPSTESLHKIQQGRFIHLELTQRAGHASLPAFHVIDIRGEKLHHGLSPRLIKQIHHHIAAENQVLLFINRRGFAPVLMCHQCGFVAECKRCDARLVLHYSTQRLHCHHCNSSQVQPNNCPSCQQPSLLLLGQGTERIEAGLQELFADVEIVRIDRDNISHKGALDELLKRITHGRKQILVGTQMLAKGHHFPNVGLVGILDADGGLYSHDFRATERMGQLLIQVAGRAGRADISGEVWIQTRHPEHPLLQTLIQNGYQTFSQRILEERLHTQLPPYAALALWRAETTTLEKAMKFLEHVKQHAKIHKMNNTNLWGPVSAPQQKRGGKFRAQLIMHAQNRTQLQQWLKNVIAHIETLKEARYVKWSVDVDPVDLS